MSNTNPLYDPSLPQRILSLFFRRKTLLPFFLFAFILFPFFLFSYSSPDTIYQFSHTYMVKYFGNDVAKNFESLKYPTVRLVARTEERRLEDIGVGELGGWSEDRLFPRNSGVGGEGWAWDEDASSSLSTKTKDIAAPLFSSVFPFLQSTPSHLIPTVPLLPELPDSPNVPKPEELLFSIVTTPERAKEMSQLWQFFLRPRFRERGPSGLEEEGEGRPKCVVVLPPDAGEKNRTEVESFLRTERDLRCKVVVEPKIERYESRVLGSLKHMRHHASNIVRNGGADIKWYIMGDDDTFWLDIRTLRRMLSKYNPEEKKFIGTTSESTNQIKEFGTFAYGGAGMIISPPLMDSMYLKWNECYDKFHKSFGGDGMISSCAGLAMGTSKALALTVEPGMHQFDVKGGGQGIFQSGMPFLSMHHLAAWMWIGLMPWGHPVANALEQNVLMGKAAWFLGGDNMFRRWVFDDGKTVVIMGYAVVFYEKPVPKDDWKKVEWTWEWAWELKYPWRKGIPEYSAGHPQREDSTYQMQMDKFDDTNQKVSYYLESIDILDEREAKFTFINEKRERINVIWDGNWEFSKEAKKLREKESASARVGQKEKKSLNRWR